MAEMSSASSDIDRRPFAPIAPGVYGTIATRMGGDLGASFASANRAARRRRTAHSFQRNFTKMNRSDAIDSYLSLDVN